jgi:hypothetical protein
MIIPSHQLAVVRLGHYKGVRAAGGATRAAVGQLVEAVQPVTAADRPGATAEPLPASLKRP